jgi:outer membrane receptor protein involved in Fe transport
VALSAEAVYDRYKSDEGINPDLPLKVRTISFPLRARYFHPSGWFGGVDFTYVDQHVDMSSASMQPGGDSGFGVVDLSVGYRLKRRQGIISIGIQNLLDRDFNYLDDSYREFRDEPSAGPYIPEITGVIRTTFSF